MSTPEIDFELRVQPKAGWVDSIFIGNILGEFLASLQKETQGAFEYALVQNGKGKAPSGMCYRCDPKGCDCEKECDRLVSGRCSKDTSRTRHRITNADGIVGDWGKTRPFWCLTCGRGYMSVERVLAHYSNAGHGNESMSVGSRGLTKKQQMDAFRLRNK